MHRFVIPLILLATAALASVGAIADPSAARPGLAQGAEIPDSEALIAFCPVVAEEGTPTPGAGWETADVRPFHEDAATIKPAASERNHLALMEVHLPPGECMPSGAGGNSRDGAVVFIVQKGEIEFLWEPGVEETTPVVNRGDMNDAAGADVPQDEIQILEEGDWIVIDQEINFAYRNVGKGTAILAWAVWANPDDVSSGGGGHKS